ncbi:MAG TPA: tetratricopeptide repeat protein [Pyrinomonadaceae bacterium]|nr:tetratricopeptide repeat protein [Pyrinomonadaceae bacterium]
MHCRSLHKEFALALSILFLLSSSLSAQKSVSSVQPVTFLDSTREQDGLAGSVRRVKIENASLQFAAGKLEEGPRQLLEVTTYALNGKRIDNVSYPLRSGPSRKEEYRYDDKGNIIEMTLRGADGSILSREAYEYEFDRFGNWRKMVTSLVVFEGGELKREPVEITYRTFTYYFDDAVASVIDSNVPAALPKAPLLGSSRSLGTDIPIGGTVFRAASEQVAAVDSHAESNSAPPMPRPSLTSTVVEKTEMDLENSAPRRGKRGLTEDVDEERPSEVRPTAKLSNNKVAVTETRAAVPPPASSERNGTSSNAALSFYKIGRASFDSGDPKSAVRAFLDSLKIEPKSAEVNLSLGNAYIALKKPHEAIKAFKRAIELDPDLAEAHYGLGLKYHELGRFRDAANSFKKAAHLDPSMAKAHFGLALAYQELGDDSGRTEHYRILQRLDAGLAKRLEQSFAKSVLPCGGKPFCQ